MSLINDALKRVEQSLNDNLSIQKSQRNISSLSLEPSGSNKKLFFIILIGSTLFLSVLILLLVLIFSNAASTSPSQSTSLAKSNTALLAEPIETHHDQPNHQPNHQPNQTELSIAPTVTQNNHNQSNSDSKEVASSSTSTSNDTEDSNNPSHQTVYPNNEERNFNRELFEGILNVASKAFSTPTTPSITNPPSSDKLAPISQAPKENLKLSTAQKTLDTIEQESQQPKKLPENKVQRFIDSLSINGVMISKDESMVLINNQVFLKNATINPELNLQLIDIQPQKIVLQDNLGTTYNVEF